jgi:hypothetical protein
MRSWFAGHNLVGAIKTLARPQRVIEGGFGLFRWQLRQTAAQELQTRRSIILSSKHLPSSLGVLWMRTVKRAFLKKGQEAGVSLRLLRSR